MEQENLDLLLESIRKGEDQAFRIVMRRWHKPLAALAFHLVRDYHAAEDVVAEAFMKLFESRDKMRSIQHVENFLRLAVKNKCLTTLTKDQRRDELSKLGPAQPDRGEEADTNLITAELLYYVRSALDQQPEHIRRAYELHTLEERTAKEVGEHLAISDQTVREYVKRVKKALHAALVRNDLHTPLILLAIGMLL